MPQQITVPRLGWSMEEGVFVEWLKAPEEFVRAGDMIFLLEGEKAAHEIESLDSGRLCIPTDAPRPGSTVKVGDIIGFLLAEGEQAPTSVRSGSITAKEPAPFTAQPPALASTASTCNTPPAPSISPAAAHASSPRSAGPAARRLARELGIDLNAVSTSDPTGRVLSGDIQRTAIARDRQGEFGNNSGHAVATPRARRRAQELGLDWARLAGTGRNGRIRERDVLACQTLPDATTAQLTQESQPTEPGSFKPASKLRLAIAQRMAAGVHQAVPVTLTTKVDAQALVALRERLKIESTDGLVPSYNDILIYLAAQTLRELPDLNACWYRNGIHTYDEINIATAVDTPGGLLAPVVRQVDRLSVQEIASSTRQLITQAQSGKLSQNQLSGATFTLSSLGMFGIDAFTPILNLPQAAILGVGRIIEEPVVRDGQLAVGKTITLSLTFDHRVVDGAPAARWLQRLSDRIISP